MQLNLKIKYRKNKIDVGCLKGHKEIIKNNKVILKTQQKTYCFY